jgi:uncharacterized protein (TIGR03437 family)
MNRLFIPLLLVAFSLPAQTVPSSPAFDQDAVHEIRLTFQQSDWWQQLTKNFQENEDDVPYISAALAWGDLKFDSVGVRFKGNSSYTGASTKKKPFRVKLNQYVKGQKVGGAASFSLSNAWNDPSFVREKPYYEMAAAAGLKAPRSNFAALYINDQYWGLYVMSEVVNGDFLTSRFAKGDDGGNLYKAQIGGALTYLGDDPMPYARFYEKQSNEDANDWTDLIELCRLIDQTDAADFPSKVAPLLDIDSILTALALDNLTVNLDSYVDMAQNYYLYRQPSTGKWVWIVWDPSLAFGAFTAGMTVQQQRQLPLEWTVADSGSGAGGFPGGGGPGALGGQAASRPLATKLWQVPEYKRRYEEIYRKLATTILLPDTLITRMNSLRSMIRPWVVLDTQKLVTQAQFDAAMTTDITNPGPDGSGTNPGALPDAVGGRGAIPGLDPFIRARVMAVSAYLDGKTPLSATASLSSLLFAQAAGGASPAAQAFTLSLSDPNQDAKFTANPSAPWVTASPASGSLPAKVTAAVNGSGMAVGSYSASVIVAVAGVTNSPVAIPVTFVVTDGPSLAASPASVSFAAGFSGAPGGGAATTPQTVQLISTAGATPFTATFAATSCGNFVTLSPTSGTTPATVTVTPAVANQTGNCAGIITFSGGGVQPVKVSVTASPGGGGFPGGAAPTITAITNAASYSTGTVAPGEIVSIFGSGLGLPANPGGGPGVPGGPSPVQVLFDNVTAPVIYSSAGQVNAIVPFGISGKSQVAVTVNVLGQASAAMQKPVGVASPGVFTTGPNGTGAAAGTVPSAKGSTITVYLTGAGLLDPAGIDGQTAPAGALSKLVAPVRATIGGQAAAVGYAGAVPGSMYGLYQVNLTIPETVGSGNQPLLLSVGGIAAQSGVTVPVQ